MYWYTTPQDWVPEDVVYLKKATGVRREEVAGRKHTFIITSKNVERIFGFANPMAPKVTIFPFGATDAEQMESWLRVVGKAIVRFLPSALPHPSSPFITPPSLLTLPFFSPCQGRFQQSSVRHGACPGCIVRMHQILACIVYIHRPIDASYESSYTCINICGCNAHITEPQRPHKPRDSATTTEWDETSDRIEEAERGGPSAPPKEEEGRVIPAS